MELYKHQNLALDLTTDFNRVAYYLDMGLGKTFVGSEKMKELGSQLNVLVCQKSKIQDWMEHLGKYYPFYFTVIDGTKEKVPYILKAIEVNVCPTVIVINYDLLFRRSYFQNLEHFTLLLDESSIIQNSKAERTKFILKMKPDNVILLSGTPSSGKYENLWSQIHLLGWNISEQLYNKQYVNWRKQNLGGTPFWYVDKKEPYKNVDRLKQKLREHGAVFMKTEECFDLPGQIEVPIKINKTYEYEKFQKDCVLTLDTRNLVEFHDHSDFEGEDVTPRIELVGDTSLTKRLYLRQLCGQYNKEKLRAFKELLESTNDRLIVFYNFNEEFRRLKNIVENCKKPLSVINGETKDLEPYENEDNSVTLVQYQAGAMGLNLQKANKIVYFTLTDKSELFEQSKKRIHRIGQSQTCFYYLMMCRNSIEEAVYETLQKRKDFNDELFKKYEESEMKGGDDYGN